MSTPHRRRRRIHHLLTSAILATLLPPARAEFILTTWTNAASTGLWSDPANWSGSVSAF